MEFFSYLCQWRVRDSIEEFTLLFEASIKLDNISNHITYVLTTVQEMQFDRSLYRCVSHNDSY